VADAETLARPYTRALLDIALEESSERQWQDFLAVLAGVFKDDELKSLVAGKIITKTMLTHMFSGVFTGLTQHQQNFLECLGLARKFHLIPVIDALFNQMLQDHKNKHEVLLQVPEAFFEVELPASLKASVAASFATDVEFNREPAATLLGGFVAKCGSKVKDGSINNRVDMLKQALLN